MPYPEEATVLTVPAHEISNQEDFESLRRTAYQEGRTGDLTSAAMLAELSGGGNLHDLAVQEVLEPDDPSVEALRSARERSVRLSKAAGKTATVYEVSIQPEGDITDITKKVIGGEDPRITNRQKRMAKQVGYGPKQNDSSFAQGRQSSFRRL